MNKQALQPFSIVGKALAEAKPESDADRELSTDITSTYQDGTERQAQLCIWRTDGEGPELGHLVVSLSFLNDEGLLIGGEEGDLEEAEAGVETCIYNGLGDNFEWTFHDIVTRFGFKPDAPIWDTNNM